MKYLIKYIFNIFIKIGKFFFAVYRFCLTCLILFFIGFIVLSITKTEKTQIEPNTILQISIDGDLVEKRSAPTAFYQLFSPFYTERPPETLVFDVVEAIDRASMDHRISLLRLDLSNMGSAGLDNLQMLGQKLQQFKLSGKKVIIAQDNYSQMQYYLASYADTVILNPNGAVFLHGFGSYRLYFKELLDKLSITYNIFQVGTYKSALEPFTRTSMSKEDREQRSNWLQGLWDIYTADVNRERALGPDALLKYTNYTPTLLQKTGGNSGQLALDSGLVDHLLQHHEIDKFILKEMGATSLQKVNTVSMNQYLSSVSNNKTESLPQIGVIIAEGNIIPGKQPTGVISADLIAETIRDASENDNIKALVLRINSGGGSAFASEIIRQELLQFKKSGKPLLVSMGRVAASGGYWISADADEIWASAATITGSIGIFGAIPTFEKSLSQLGIYSDGIGTTPVASGLNLTRALPNNIKQSIQLTVEHGYNQFLSIVSTGRDMDLAEVEKIAQGRVYDGRTAQKIGLVDSLGSLENTIDRAAVLAKLDDYEEIYLQATPSFQKRMLELLSAKLTAFFPEKQSNNQLQGLLSEVINKVNTFAQINDPRGIYVYGGEFEY